MTTFRTLALIAAHAREKICEQQASATPHLPYLRACVLESLRLWPTTPMVLRQSVRETTWEGGVMPAETGILIFAPFFHRDDEVLPYANRFAPEVWLDSERDPKAWPLIPFSGGPAIRPGRHLVLLTSTVLGSLIAERQVWLKPLTRLDARRPL